MVTFNFLRRTPKGKHYHLISEVRQLSIGDMEQTARGHRARLSPSSACRASVLSAEPHGTAPPTPRPVTTPLQLRRWPSPLLHPSSLWVISTLTKFYRLYANGSTTALRAGLAPQFPSSSLVDMCVSFSSASNSALPRPTLRPTLLFQPDFFFFVGLVLLTRTFYLNFWCCAIASMSPAPTR